MTRREALRTSFLAALAPMALVRAVESAPHMGTVDMIQDGEHVRGVYVKGGGKMYGLVFTVSDDAEQDRRTMGELMRRGNITLRQRPWAHMRPA